MHFDKTTLRAAYEFLRVAAFDRDPALPHGRFVRFHARKLSHHGYHDFVKGRHTIWVDTIDTRNADLMLRIVAHEMIHLARRDHVYNTDEEAHDTGFKQAARLVEEKMGWSKNSV